MFQFIDSCSGASLNPQIAGSDTQIKAGMNQMLAENGLKLMKKRLNVPDVAYQQDMAKMPDTGKIKMELSNTLDELYNNFYQQFMDQVQPKKLIEFLKNITVPMPENFTSPQEAAQAAIAAAAAAAAASGGFRPPVQTPESYNKRNVITKRNEATSVKVSKRVEFLNPPMPPQVNEMIEDVELTDLNNVKESIETKLNKLYSYGNQYRNFALEFLSQYLSLLGEFGMQFRDLGINVVKSIGGDQMKQQQ